MTVSYSFNRPERVAQATRVRVLEAAAKLGYRPDATARALRSGRARQLGVVVGEHLSYLFEDPQAAQFLAGVSDVCVEQDLGVVLIPTRGDVSDVDRVLSAAVDGYVLWTTVAGDPVLAAVAGSGRPAAIQGGPAHEHIACIGPDDRAAAAAVTAAAVAAAAGVSAAASPPAVPFVISFPLDRRRTYGVLRGRDLPADLLDPEVVPFPVTAGRLAGYRDALTAAGHPWDDVRVAVVERNQRHLGAAATQTLLGALDDNSPVVLLAMSDELALGAHAVMTRSGRAATITGFDGTQEAAGAGIWSVAASLRDQGRACARAALSPEPGRDQVPWELVRPAA